MGEGGVEGGRAVVGMVVADFFAQWSVSRRQRISLFGKL